MQSYNFFFISMPVVSIKSLTLLGSIFNSFQNKVSVEVATSMWRPNNQSHESHSLRKH